ncbi:MAG: hypothetical protein ACXVCY_17055 [Pseudobdellovibrionaceae bacterium]
MFRFSFLVLLSAGLFPFTVFAESSPSKLRPLIHFLDKQQAQFTQLYSGWQGFQCEDLSTDEKKIVLDKLTKKSECSKDDKNDPSLTQDTLDDLFFHTQALEYKQALACEKQKNDCMFELKNMHRFLNGIFSSDIENIILAGKILNEMPLSNSEQAIVKTIDQAIPDASLHNAKIDYCAVLKTFQTNLNLTDRNQDQDKKCFEKIKNFLKLSLWEKYSSTLFYEVKAPLINSIATVQNDLNKVSDCELRKKIEENFKDFFYNRRRLIESEENKIARSCVMNSPNESMTVNLNDSQQSSQCFYKPTYKTKRYLLDMGFQNTDPFGQGDTRALTKYYCHLNRTYGEGSDKLNSDISDYAIPVLGLAVGGYGVSILVRPFVWATAPVAAELQFGGSIIASQMRKNISKNKLLKHSVKGGKAAFKATDAFVTLAALGLTGQKISKACIKSVNNIAYNSAPMDGADLGCSCESLMQMPIKNLKEGCRIEIVKTLVDRSLGYLSKAASRTKTAVTLMDKQHGQALDSKYAALLNSHFSDEVSTYKKIFSTENAVSSVEQIRNRYLNSLNSVECK